MDLVLTLLACTVLLVAPPELDTAQSCMSVVSCAPTQANQQARFYLRADAVDQSGNVSLLSVLSAQVEFDIVHWSDAAPEGATLLHFDVPDQTR